MPAQQPTSDAFPREAAMQACMHCQPLFREGWAHVQQDVESLEEPVLEVLPFHRVHREGICAAARRARVDSRLVQQRLQNMPLLSIPSLARDSNMCTCSQMGMPSAQKCVHARI